MKTFKNMEGPTPVNKIVLKMDAFTKGDHLCIQEGPTRISI